MNAPEQRDAGRDQHQVGAHVGQQVDVQAADPAVGVGGDPDPLPLVPAVVHGHVALAAGLGPLDRPAQLAGDQHRQHFLGRDLQLRAEPAAHVGRDHPDVLLRMPVTRASMTRSTCGIWVADHNVNSSPSHGGDHRARLHRARDQPLLPVGALQHHGGVAERGLDVAVAERSTRSSCCRPRAPSASPRPARSGCRAPAAAARSRPRWPRPRRRPRTGYGRPRRPRPRPRSGPRRPPSAGGPGSRCRG